MRKFLTPAAWLVTAAVLMMFQGCASLGLAPADTMEKQLGYAFGIHAAVLRTAAASLDRAEISSEEAESVLAIADNARTFLNAARTALGIGDIKTAEAKLQLATAVLNQLQEYLRSREKP